MILPPLRLTPQAGPATWRGADLTPSDWMLPVGGEEATDLAAAIAQSGAAPSPRIVALLDQVTRRLDAGRGFVLLRGLPLGRFDAPGAAEALLGAIGGWLGTPLPQDAAGRLVASQAEETVTPFGAPMRFQADPADAVVLFCLRQVTAGGSVTLLSAPAIHNALLKADRAALLTLHKGLPHRATAPEASAGGEVVVANPVIAPVFSTVDGTFVSRCDHGAILEQAMTDAHRAALTALEAAATASGLALTLSLSPGDLLFRNPALVWKRAGTATPPGGERAAGERVLLRLWLATPGSRTVPACYRSGIIRQPALVGG